MPHGSLRLACLVRVGRTCVGGRKTHTTNPPSCLVHAWPHAIRQAQMPTQWCAWHPWARLHALPHGSPCLACPITVGQTCVGGRKTHTTNTPSCLVHAWPHATRRAQAPTQVVATHATHGTEVGLIWAPHAQRPHGGGMMYGGPESPPPHTQQEFVSRPEWGWGKIMQRHAKPHIATTRRKAAAQVGQGGLLQQRR